VELRGVISGPRSSFTPPDSYIGPPWGVYSTVHSCVDIHQPLFRLFRATPGISPLSDHLVFFLLLLPLFL